MPANTQHSTARDESMPYKYDSNGLAFGISSFSLDGGESGKPNYDEQVITPHKYGEWEEIQISINVTVEGSVKSVFPDNEGPPYPAKLILVIDCEQTQMRREAVVKESPVEEKTYEDEIVLNQRLLRGDVSLTPRLVRTEKCREGLPFAPNAGMRVAGGRGWTLEVDEPEESANGFPFVYRDFSQESMPSEDLIHAFSRNPDPKIMINDRKKNVVDVLQSGLTYGFRPNMKRNLKARFGNLLWIQLLVSTAATIAESGEPEFSWQEGVVLEVVEEDFGGMIVNADDYDSAVEELGVRVSDPGELREFITDLCCAVQLYSDAAKHLDSFIKEESP